MFCNCETSKQSEFHLLGPAGPGGVWASSNKNSAAILEGLSKWFVVFVCLDSLAQGSMLSGHVYFHSSCFMNTQDLVNCWCLAGRSLYWVKYRSGSSMESLIERDAQGLVQCAVHCCCNSGEGSRPFVVSFVNKVTHHLLKSANPSLNLAVHLVVILHSHPYLDT